jgi:hypothetical protein
MLNGIYRLQSIKLDREITTAEYFISGGKFEATAYAYKFPAPKLLEFPTPKILSAVGLSRNPAPES